MPVGTLLLWLLSYPSYWPSGNARCGMTVPDALALGLGGGGMAGADYSLAGVETVHQPVSLTSHGSAGWFVSCQHGQLDGGGMTACGGSFRWSSSSVPVTLTWSDDGNGGAAAAVNCSYAWAGGWAQVIHHQTLTILFAPPSPPVPLRGPPSPSPPPHSPPPPPFPPPPFPPPPPSSPPEAPPSSSSVNGWVVAGGVVGGLAVLTCLVALVLRGRKEK